MPRKPAKDDRPAQDTGRQDNREDKIVPLRRPRPCPICHSPSRPRWHPFCSRRCADIDLHRWLSGGYVIPGSEDEDADIPTTPDDEQLRD